MNFNDNDAFVLTEKGKLLAESIKASPDNIPEGLDADAVKVLLAIDDINKGHSKLDEFLKSLSVADRSKINSVLFIRDFPNFHQLFAASSVLGLTNKPVESQTRHELEFSSTLGDCMKTYNECSATLNKLEKIHAKFEQNFSGLLSKARSMPEYKEVLNDLRSIAAKLENC